MVGLKIIGIQLLKNQSQIVYYGKNFRFDKNQNVDWVWVKGHAGVLGNEKADLLAVKGREEASSELMVNVITFFELEPSNQVTHAHNIFSLSLNFQNIQCFHHMQ